MLIHLLLNIDKKLAEAERLELPTFGFGDQRSTTELYLCGIPGRKMSYSYDDGNRMLHLIHGYIIIGVTDGT